MHACMRAPRRAPRCTLLPLVPAAARGCAQFCARPPQPLFFACVSPQCTLFSLFSGCSPAAMPGDAPGGRFCIGSPRPLGLRSPACANATILAVSDAWLQSAPGPLGSAPFFDRRCGKVLLGQPAPRCPAVAGGPAGRAWWRPALLACATTWHCSAAAVPQPPAWDCSWPIDRPVTLRPHICIISQRSRKRRCLRVGRGRRSGACALCAAARLGVPPLPACIPRVAGPACIP